MKSPRRSPSAKGKHQIEVRRQRHLRPQRRQQQGVRRPHLSRQIHLQHLHPKRLRSAKASLSQQHRQRGQLSAKLRQRQLHRKRHLVVALRAGRLPRSSDNLTVNLGIALRTADLYRLTWQLRSPRRLCLRRQRRQARRSSRRLRHLLLPDRRQLRGKLRAHRTHRSLQLHGNAGTDRFPHIHRRGSAAAFPPGAPVPLRSLYIRPGQSAYLNQFFPTSTLVGYPQQAPEPLLGAVDHRIRASNSFQPGS